MATDTVASRSREGRIEIPVRNITSEDLKISLRQGLDDFLEMRGDLIFVGLLYPLIGILAAVFTTQGALPFFLPIVAGVGLARTGRGRRFLRAGPQARSGARLQLVAFPRRPQAAGDRRHGDRGRAAAGDFRILAVRRRRSLCRILRLGSVRLDRAQHHRRLPARCLHDSARLGPDRYRPGRRAPSSAGSCWRSASPRCRCWSTATSAHRRRCPRHGAPRMPTSRR